MKKIIRLTERDLTRIVKRTIMEMDRSDRERNYIEGPYSMGNANYEKNHEKFNKEINAKIKNTKNNQKLKIQFSNNNAIELVVGNNFKNNKDQNCKNLNLQKKIKITEINEPVNASISICSQNNEWKFVSINLN